jgi:hypothetical protein
MSECCYLKNVNLKISYSFIFFMTCSTKKGFRSYLSGGGRAKSHHANPPQDHAITAWYSFLYVLYLLKVVTGAEC